MIATKKSDAILAVGRRKSASARVRLRQTGTGKITVNNKVVEKYFFHETMFNMATAPLKAVDALDSHDIDVTVHGGGLFGQAGAVSHGIARALEKLNAEWRTPLKKEGLLKRDPREKERKKPGQPGARKRFQFSKR